MACVGENDRGIERPSNASRRVKGEVPLETLLWIASHTLDTCSRPEELRMHET